MFSPCCTRKESLSQETRQGKDRRQKTQGCQEGRQEGCPQEEGCRQEGRQESQEVIYFDLPMNRQS